MAVHRGPQPGDRRPAQRPLHARTAKRIPARTGIAGCDRPGVRQMDTVRRPAVAVAGAPHGDRAGLLPRPNGGRHRAVRGYSGGHSEVAASLRASGVAYCSAGKGGCAVTNFASEDDLAEWDAAYVLGALSLEDRRTYEDYLAEHPARAAELTEFAGMPGILNALSREEALALTDLAGAPPSEQRPDNMVSLAQAAAKRQQRSRRNWLVGAVASAAALLVAGGIV